MRKVSKFKHASKFIFATPSESNEFYGKILKLKGVLRILDHAKDRTKELPREEVQSDASDVTDYDDFVENYEGTAYEPRRSMTHFKTTKKKGTKKRKSSSKKIQPAGKRKTKKLKTKKI